MYNQKVEKTAKNKQKVGILPTVEPVSGEVNLGKSPREFIREGVNLSTEQALQKLGKAISGGVFASEESENNHAGISATTK